MTKEEQMEEMLVVSVRAALQAGKIIMEYYGNNPVVQLKADESPVTEADKKAEELILKQINPFSIPVVAEESVASGNIPKVSKELFWLVDPLDGTKEFLKQNGEFTVNIALIENYRPVMGVVYAPALKELFVGSVILPSRKYSDIDPYSPPDLGYDALVNAGKVLSTSQKNAGRNRMTVVGSRSHLSQETVDYVEKLKEKYGEVELTSIGSSLKFCILAEGRATLYPRFGPTMEWDTAAGHAIALFTGCKMISYPDGNDFVYGKKNFRNSWFVVQNGSEMLA
jgi:3'(2'), 5'-bisphosphate nucleotidase